MFLVQANKTGGNNAACSISPTLVGHGILAVATALLKRAALTAIAIILSCVITFRLSIMIAPPDSAEMLLAYYFVAGIILAGWIVVRYMEENETMLEKGRTK